LTYPDGKVQIVVAQPPAVARILGAARTAAPGRPLWGPLVTPPRTAAMAAAPSLAGALGSPRAGVEHAPEGALAALAAPAAPAAPAGEATASGVATTTPGSGGANAGGSAPGSSTGQAASEGWSAVAAAAQRPASSRASSPPPASRQG